MSTNLLERSPLARRWDPRLACGVALTLVFLCGALVGAVVMNTGLHSRLHRTAFDTPAGKSVYFDRLQKELRLSPAQSEQMQSILNDFWQYYRTVLTDGKSRVMQILNEDQKRRFQQLLQEGQIK